MSAILGRIEFDGRAVDAGAFAAAASALAPYGPDGGGTRLLGNAAFAQYQLDIARRAVPERQPLSEGALTLVADAILDDRAGLAAALGIATQEAALMPDSALILKAWLHWGEDCPRHLTGDYAFAVWDGDQQRLFLARDHIGTRPLYWVRRGATLLFATDIRAMVGFAEFDWPIDDAMVARYMRAADRPLPRCFFAGMQPVGPGHHLTLTASGETASRWWDPMLLPVRHDIDPDTAAARLKELIERAVACRIDTDAGVGSHLSGGIDSTAVTVLAARGLRQRGQALRAAYCWAPATSAAHPDMGEWDERKIVAGVAEAEGFPLRFGDADADGFLAYLGREIEFEGTADLAEELPVIEKARADGVRVMLSGWGGDEAVTAYGTGYIAHLLRRGRPWRALRAARALGGSRNPWKLARLLWSEGIVPMLPDPLFALWSPYARMYPRQSFMRASLAARFRPPERDIRPLPSPRRFSAALLLRGHLAARMETWAAWGAAAGLQYRYPFLDRRLLDFVFSLPPEVLHGPGRGRHLVRKALRGYLPRRLSKQDLANERLRNQLRRACWTRLAAEPPEGEGGDWLDMPALRHQLARVPPRMDGGDVIAFAEICSAMRIWSLAGRRQRAHSGTESRENRNNEGLSP